MCTLLHRQAVYAVKHVRYNTEVEFLRKYNLDTVLGAMGSGFLATQLVGGLMPWSWWICLGLSVFGIYTFDRVWDGRHDSHSKRHRFHYVNRHFLTFIAFIFCVLALIVAFLFLPITLVKWGASLGLLVLLHLSMARACRYGLIKEIMIAFMYTSGIFLGPLLYKQGRSIPYEDILYFFGIVLLSLWCYTYLDDDQDRLDVLPSLSYWIGAKYVRLLSFLLWCTLIVFGILSAYKVLLLMAVCTGIMLCFPSWFRISDRYRIYGEFIFIIPLLIELVHRSTS